MEEKREQRPSSPGKEVLDPGDKRGGDLCTQHKLARPVTGFVATEVDSELISSERNLIKA